MKLLSLVIFSLCAFAHDVASFRRKEKEEINLAEYDDRLKARIAGNNEIVTALYSFFDLVRQIPMLDPFITTVGPFTSTHLGVRTETIIKHFKVEGLRQFKVEYITMDAERYVLSAKVTVPSLRITGDYESTASISFLSQTAKGSYTVTAVGVEVYFDFYLETSSMGYLELKSMTLNIILDSVTALLSNQSGSFLLNEMIETYVQVAAYNKLKGQMPEITEQIVKVITPYFSEFFRHYKFSGTSIPSYLLM